MREKEGEREREGGEREGENAKPQIWRNYDFIVFHEKGRLWWLHATTADNSEIPEIPEIPEFPEIPEIREIREIPEIR